MEGFNDGDDYDRKDNVVVVRTSIDLDLDIHHSESDNDDIICDQITTSKDHHHQKLNNVKKNTNPKTWYWSHEQIVKMIELWRSEEGLWNSLSDEYRDKNKRMIALERIRIAMEEAESPGPSVEDIMTKMNSLKVYYSSVKGKQGSLMRSGVCPDDIPPIKWPYYRHLTFLGGHITPRKSFANMDYNNNKGEAKRQKMNPREETLVVEPVECEGSLQTSTGACNLQTSACNLQTNAFNLQANLQTASGSCDLVKDDSRRHPDDVFCELIGNQLRKVPEGMQKEQLKMDLQKSIFDVLFPSPHQYRLQQSQPYVSSTFSPPPSRSAMRSTKHS